MKRRRKTEFSFYSGNPIILTISERAMTAAEKAFGRGRSFRLYGLASQIPNLDASDRTTTESGLDAGDRADALREDQT